MAVVHGRTLSAAGLPVAVPPTIAEAMAAVCPAPSMARSGMGEDDFDRKRVHDGIAPRIGMGIGWKMAQRSLDVEDPWTLARRGIVLGTVGDRTFALFADAVVVVDAWCGGTRIVLVKATIPGEPTPWPCRMAREKGDELLTEGEAGRRAGRATLDEVDGAPGLAALGLDLAAAHPELEVVAVRLDAPLPRCEGTHAWFEHANGHRHGSSDRLPAAVLRTAGTKVGWPTTGGWREAPMGHPRLASGWRPAPPSIRVEAGIAGSSTMRAAAADAARGRLAARLAVGDVGPGLGPELLKEARRAWCGEAA